MMDIRLTRGSDQFGFAQEPTAKRSENPQGTRLPRSEDLHVRSGMEYGPDWKRIISDTANNPEALTMRLNNLGRFAIAGGLALGIGMAAVTPAEAHWRHGFYYGPPIFRPVFFPRPFLPPPPPPPVIIQRPVAFVPPPPPYVYGYRYRYRHHVKRVTHRTVSHRAACTCNCCPAR